MIVKKYQNALAVRLLPGEEIIEAMTQLAREYHIGAGFVSAIGATDSFTVGVFDREKKVYRELTHEGFCEITSLIGNITRMNGDPIIHLHMTAAQADGTVYAGHLVKARITLTLEAYITIETSEITRIRDAERGINVWNLGE